MGISISCPFGSDNDLESIIVKSVCLGFDDDHVKTPERSISFKTHHQHNHFEYDDDSQSTILNNSFASRNMIVDKPDNTTSISVIPINNNNNNNNEDSFWSGSPKDQAALKLQKVYKSFRTRRKLADCAVLVEQSWWELLDFVELKHSSISFFEIEHHETAISRWSRAKTRAAKVGKGLSKNGKAQKLALQHWLEAIDPRHRYGHNLHFYYTKWLESHSRQPFFYWLDIGEGREVSSERCSRMKLQQQCIKYLGPMERMDYEVTIENKRFVHKESGKLLDTSSEPNAKWIFVLSTSKTLYVGKKKKGTFQHSSFLAGGATLAAGRLVIENGFLKAVWPHSGHYKPTPENFQEFMTFLREYNVDLVDVKLDPVDEEDQQLGKQRSSLHWRNNSSEEELVEGAAIDENSINIDITTAKPVVLIQETAVGHDHLSRNYSGRFSRKLTNLQIPKREDLLVTMLSETLVPKVSADNLTVDKSNDSSTGEVSVCEQDGQVVRRDMLADEKEAEEEVEVIPAESILQRINSHKESKSYQLGKQLSCRWTTGAGPRIGCVRDYPSGLQFRALEQVNLSPRSACVTKSVFSPSCGGRSSPKASTPIPIVSRRSMGQCRMQLSPLCKGGKRTL